MSFERLGLITLIVIVAAGQYGLAVYALRDLARRQSVRGNNKVGWGLIVLAFPFIGPLLYTYMGPTSLRRRAPVPEPRLRRTTSRGHANDPGMS